MGFKGYQPVKAWEDIKWTVHPPANEPENCEGREDVQAGRLYKVN